MRADRSRSFFFFLPHTAYTPATDRRLINDRDQYLLTTVTSAELSFGGKKPRALPLLPLCPDACCELITKTASPEVCVYVCMCVCAHTKVCVRECVSSGPDQGSRCFTGLVPHVYTHTETQHTPGGFGHRMPGTCGSLRRCSAAREPVRRLVDLLSPCPEGPNSRSTASTHRSPSVRTQM